MTIGSGSVTQPGDASVPQQQTPDTPPSHEELFGTPPGRLPDSDIPPLDLPEATPNPSHEEIFGVPPTQNIPAFPPVLNSVLEPGLFPDSIEATTLDGAIAEYNQSMRETNVEDINPLVTVQSEAATVLSELNQLIAQSYGEEHRLPLPEQMEVMQYIEEGASAQDAAAVIAANEQRQQHNAQSADYNAGLDIATADAAIAYYNQVMSQINVDHVNPNVEISREQTAERNAWNAEVTERTGVSGFYPLPEQPGVMQYLPEGATAEQVAQITDGNSATLAENQVTIAYNMQLEQVMGQLQQLEGTLLSIEQKQELADNMLSYNSELSEVNARIEAHNAELEAGQIPLETYRYVIFSNPEQPYPENDTVMTQSQGQALVAFGQDVATYNAQVANYNSAVIEAARIESIQAMGQQLAQTGGAIGDTALSAANGELIQVDLEGFDRYMASLPEEVLEASGDVLSATRDYIVENGPIWLDNTGNFLNATGDVLGTIVGGAITGGVILFHILTFGQFHRADAPELGGELVAEAGASPDIQAQAQQAVSTRHDPADMRHSEEPIAIDEALIANIPPSQAVASAGVGV